MDIDQTKKRDWYFKRSTLIVGFLFLGPFVIPLVWLNPHYSRFKKISLCLLILFLSFICLLLIIKFGQPLSDYYHSLKNNSLSLSWKAG
ncbi:MAG: hypothetical protein H6755_04995 [Candidatus Omnitrophica bacterium]|nr:hypothetical protein [Candidatus Omnitrophota bacterium]MCB9747749.1 hypothetical protein [Candidatus Omnitrophota bacterium]